MEQQPGQFEPPDVSFQQLHHPLMRLLPPAIRHRPKGVEGSLRVVEGFFGAGLSPKMVDVAATLSKRQLNDLERQLGRESMMTDEALEVAERPGRLVAERFQTVRSVFKSSLERDMEKVLPSRAEDSFFWSRRHIVNVEEIGMHEDLIPAQRPGTSLDIGNVPVLKQMALYCQQTVVRDPLYTPSDVLYDYRTRFPQEAGNDLYSLEARRRRIAGGLRQLLAIAPLVRSGAFVLVAERPSDELFTRSAARSDPFLGSILSQVRPDWHQELLELQAISYSEMSEQTRNRQRELDVMAQDVVRNNYPYPVSDQSWQRIIWLSRWAYTYSLTSFTSDPEIVRHLEQGARIAMDGPDAALKQSGYSRKIAPGAQAVSYQVPSLSETSYADIARLRDSSLFDNVRTAMVELAQVCASSAPQDFDDYQRLVAENAQGIIGPLYRKVERWRRLGRGASLGIFAGGHVLRMGVSGVAGQVAAAGVKRLGEEYIGQKQQTNETARGILRSLLQYK